MYVLMIRYIEARIEKAKKRAVHHDRIASLCYLIALVNAFTTQFGWGLFCVSAGLFNNWVASRERNEVERLERSLAKWQENRDRAILDEEDHGEPC